MYIERERDSPIIGQFQIAEDDLLQDRCERPDHRHEANAGDAAEVAAAPRCQFAGALRHGRGWPGLIKMVT